MDFKKILEHFADAEAAVTKQNAQLNEAAFTKSGVKADAKKNKSDATTRKQYFVKLAKADGGSKGVTVMADEGESESEVRSRVARDHKSQGWTVSSIREKGDAAEKAEAGEKKSSVTASGKKRGRPPGSTKKVTEGRQTVSEYIAEARLMEKSMSPKQKSERERIVKGMKQSKDSFEKRYPGRGEEVMYATATKRAMKESQQEVTEGIKQLARKFDPTIKSRLRNKANALDDEGDDVQSDLDAMGMARSDAMTRAMNPEKYYKNADRYRKLANKESVEEGAKQFSPEMHDRIKNATPQQLSQMATDLAGDSSRYEYELKLLQQAQKELQGVSESYTLVDPGTPAEEAVKALKISLEQEKEFLSRQQQAHVLKMINILKTGDIGAAWDYKVNSCGQDMSEWIDEVMYDNHTNPFAEYAHQDGIKEGADKESQMWGGFINKFFSKIYEYGDDGLEHLDGAAPLWAKLWAKHNGDIDAIIAAEPAGVLNRAAQELKHVMDDLHTGLAEGAKCNHTEEGKECPVHGLKECGTYMEESQFDEDLASMKKIAGVGALAAAGLGANISGENAEIRAKEVEKLEKQVASQPDSVKRGQLEKMIKDIKAGKPLSKGDIISEVSPHSYDSDVDYYDAVEAEEARLRGDYDDAEEAHYADQADQKAYDDDMYEDSSDEAEYSDEVGMVENNLETIERAAEELDSILQDGEDLPEWVEEKVSNAKAMLVSAKEYMASQHANGDVHNVDDEELAEGIGSMIKRGVKKIQGTNRVEKAYTDHMNKSATAGDQDKELARARKALYVGGAKTAEKAYDQYHTKKYGHAPSRQQWTDDEMDEGNEFSGALAKAKASGAKEFSVDGKSYPVKESRSAIDELAECYDMAYQQAQAEPEQPGRMSVSANTSTEGTRSLTVNAEGDMADELAQLLSLSGLAGGRGHQEEMDESSADEFHANTRPEPKTFSLHRLLDAGDDLNSPKAQHPAAAARGDNPLTR